MIWWHGLLAVVIGLALVAYVLQQIEPMAGRRLWLYVGSVVACGSLGGLAFVELGYTPVFGAITGVAMVAFAQPLGKAVPQMFKRFLGRFFDRFSREKEHGFGGDRDE